MDNLRKQLNNKGKLGMVVFMELDYENRKVCCVQPGPIEPASTALERYANTPCPASILLHSETKEEMGKQFDIAQELINHPDYFEDIIQYI